jgi:hypothetical protein
LHIPDDLADAAMSGRNWGRGDAPEHLDLTLFPVAVVRCRRSLLRNDTVIIDSIIASVMRRGSAVGFASRQGGGPSIHVLRPRPRLSVRACLSCFASAAKSGLARFFARRFMRGPRQEKLVL